MAAESDQKTLKKISSNSIILTISGLGAALIAYAWLVVKASWYWNNREDLSFGWVVLLLSGYVIYEQWGKWENKKKPSPGVLIKILSGLMMLSGIGLLFQFQVYTASMGMKPAALMGLMTGCYLVIFGNLLWNWGLAGGFHFAFGVLFLVVAMPMPSIIQGLVINGLQSVVTTVVVEILTLVGIPAQQVGSLIHLPTGTVGVDEACSGVRSLQSTVMATLFIGYLCLKNWSMQLVLLVAGVIFTFVGNLVRAFFLSYVANAEGIDAVDKYHDGAGYSIMIFSIIGVAALAWLIIKFEKLTDEHRNEMWLTDLLAHVHSRRPGGDDFNLELDMRIDSPDLNLDPDEKAEVFNEIQKKFGIYVYETSQMPETWREVLGMLNAAKKSS